VRRSLTICVVLCGCWTGVSPRAQAGQTSTPSPAVSASLNPMLPILLSPVAPSTSSTASNSQPIRPAVERGSGISADILAKIPRQVLSSDGRPGDVNNFLILGSKHDMKKAMDAAGWDTVACTKLGVIWRDLFESLYIKAYRGIPMTKLYMFGRQQDYGYAHSRGLLSVRNRHHFRIWLAPFLVNGQPLWIGAGTHDVALHHVGRFLHLFHKIDPNVDAERQFISATLIKAKRIRVLGYVTADGAPTVAQTTNGQDFYTDGRTLIMQLLPENTATLAASAELP
jgi:LssY C-terminus